MTDPLIDSLERAVQAAPGDVTLRLHLAELLMTDGRGPEAVVHCAVALQAAPGDERAQLLMTRALSPAPPSAGTGPGIAPADPPDPASRPGFDWSAAENQFGSGPAPPFVHADDATEPLTDTGTDDRSGAVWDVERPGVSLSDVGGLADVKDRLEVSFLAPMRNPDLRRMYGKSLRGGLLLYGPPGCGKTFIARAVAGEMGASFINVTLTDVLDMYVGNSEANLHGMFEVARSRTPCVIFLDEVDAIGQKRSRTRHSGTRGVVNQLLQELDGIGSDNEGVYVLAATNAPWDIDPALRRPGRLDRMVLVLPPDESAREAILRHHLSSRPIEGVDLGKLGRLTDGHTGADLAHLCESAAEKALMDSVRSGEPRRITMDDLVQAAREVRPSAGPWFDVARNVVEYADRSGEYTELRAFMKRNRLL